MLKTRLKIVDNLFENRSQKVHFFPRKVINNFHTPESYLFSTLKPIYKDLTINYLNVLSTFKQL